MRPRLVIALFPALLLAQGPFTDKEKALGRSIAADIEQRNAPIQDPEITSYIERLGRRLTAPLPAGFSFSVVSTYSPSLPMEPMFYPGGHIFVGLQLISAANSESELAGMIAHAIAHSWERHGVKSTNAGGIPLIFMGGWTASGDLAVPTALLEQARELELKADRRAVDLMLAAGYRSQSLVDFIARTTPVETRPRSAFPPREIRIQAVSEYAQDHGRDDSSEFHEIRNRVRSLQQQLQPVPKTYPPRLRRVSEQR